MDINKRLLILAVMVVALAAVVMVQRNVFSPPNVTSPPLGYPLWQEPLALNQVTALTLQGGGKTCRLVKDSKRWQVENRYAYCADFERITKLLKKISRLKVGYAFTADKATMARLRLEKPSAWENAKGVRIVMNAADGRKIADLVIGRQRQATAGSGGQFVRKTGRKTVFLVDETFHLLNPGPEYWIQDDLISVEPRRIKLVECYDRRGSLIYRVEHPDPTRPAVLAKVPEGRKVSRPKMDQLFDALNPLKVADILGPAPDKPPKAVRLVYHLDDGSRFTVFLLTAKKGELYQVLLRSSPGRQTPKGESAAAGCAALADPGTWLYGVEKWQFESFFTDPEQLLEPR